MKLQIATLVAQNKALVDFDGARRNQLLDLVKTVKSWQDRLDSDTSVTQSQIAKEAGVSRSRVGQLLPIGRHSEKAATLIETEDVITIDSLRRRLNYPATAE